MGRKKAFLYHDIIKACRKQGMPMSIIITVIIMIR